MKYILIALIICFCLSNAYLIFRESEERDPMHEKSSWTIYFTNPTDNSLDFVIENFTTHIEFTYSISTDNQTLYSENTVIPSGETQTITPTIKLKENSRIYEIHVQHGKESRKIQKHF